MNGPAQAREELLAELRERALVIGKVTLASGAEAEYYVDVKRAILRPQGFRAVGALIAAEATDRGAEAVGGLTMGADPLASAAIGDQAGDELIAFFVRKEKKDHGLQR
ncbi:MAG: orotate phosphoribosyltransferase, partial [bacterium]